MFQAIAPNAFFVFAGTFPTNNAVANLLLGAPVTFYQGLGDFSRELRVWSAAPTRRTSGESTRTLTLNYGMRYERINPITESAEPDERFRPRRAVDGAARCAARAGLSRRSGHRRRHRAELQRVHAAGRRSRGIRPARAYGRSARATALFYDQFQNGAGTASQVPVSSMPWAQFNQYSGAGLNFQNPVRRRVYPAAEHLRPAVHGVHHRPAARAAVCAELERRRPALAVRPVSARGALCRRARATTCRATSKPTRRSSVPARRRRTPTAAASTPTVPADGGTCDFSTIAMLSYITQFDVPRRPGQPVAALFAPASASTSRTGFRNRWTTCRR